MNDKELLMMAAKAAGVPLVERIGLQKDYFADDRTGNEWNPLTDDGDALRLAVKLNLSVSTGPCQASATSIDGALIGFFPKEDTIYQCPYAATRRAIVRAAAEIGAGL